MKDRFDLEQNIMKSWNITDDIELLYSNVLEKDMSTDDIANCLLGIMTIYNLRFEELFDTFTELVKDRKIV